jgi:DNA-directed RNA polymerase specialized sigma24 family protein
MFPKVEKMLYDLAWRGSRMTGVDFEDAKSEAFSKFMEVCETYDPKKGSKFSSWLHYKVWRHMQDLGRGRGRNRLVFVDKIKDEMVSEHQHAFRATIMDQMSNLSPEAQELIQTLIESPETEDPKEMLREACRDLAFNRGHDRVHTRIVVHEIKASLKPKLI